MSDISLLIITESSFKIFLGAVNMSGIFTQVYNSRNVTL